MKKDETTYKGDLSVSADDVPSDELKKIVKMLESLQKTFAFDSNFWLRTPNDNLIRISIYSECDDDEQLMRELDSIEDLVNTHLYDALPELSELSLEFRLNILNNGTGFYPYIKEIKFKERDPEKRLAQINEALKLNTEVVYPIKDNETLKLHVSGPEVDEKWGPYIGIASPDNSILTISLVDTNTGEVKFNKIRTKRSLERCIDWDMVCLGRKCINKDYRDHCGFWLYMIIWNNKINLNHKFM